MRRRHRLTLEGVLFIGVTFAIGLAAFNTGTNLLYLICSMLFSFLIVSGIASTNSIRGLTASRLSPRHAVAGEPCRIEISVRNLKRWRASYSIRILDRLQGGKTLGAVYWMTVPRRSTIHAAYRALFPQRGLYRLAELEVASRFPFGLIERSFSIPREHEIVVYPRLVDIRPVLRDNDLDLGEIESSKQGPGVSLYQIREYTGQESARLIHWKTSARARKLMVMEFEKEEKRRVCFYLNNSLSPSHPPSHPPSPSSPGSESRSSRPSASAAHSSPSSPPTREVLAERFERAVVLAASLAKYFLETGYTVQLVTASGKVPFGAGVSHVHRCLRALAGLPLLESSASAAQAPSPSAPGRSGSPPAAPPPGGSGASASSSAHPFMLPPPEADCSNVFVHFDPSRLDSVYSASATVLDIERWYDLLNPRADTAPSSSHGV